MRCQIHSLYLCVKDMDRAIAFYQHLLGQKVTEKDAVYSVFALGGFRLGLFAYAKVGEHHTYGNNRLPSIEVDDLAAIQQKLSGIGRPVVFGLKRIKNYDVLEFVDSEGNQIEATALAQSRYNGHST